jgi:hypothetical protein
MNLHEISFTELELLEDQQSRLGRRDKGQKVYRRLHDAIATQDTAHYIPSIRLAGWPDDVLEMVYGYNYRLKDRRFNRSRDKAQDNAIYNPQPYIPDSINYLNKKDESQICPSQMQLTRVLTQLRILSKCVVGKSLNRELKIDIFYLMRALRTLDVPLHTSLIDISVSGKGWDKVTELITKRLSQSNLISYCLHKIRRLKKGYPISIPKSTYYQIKMVREDLAAELVNSVYAIKHITSLSEFRDHLELCASEVIGKSRFLEFELFSDDLVCVKLVNEFIVGCHVRDNKVIVALQMLNMVNLELDMRVLLLDVQESATHLTIGE